VAFAICFGVLFMRWYRHYRFCRRYGLQDLTTHLLSAALVFVVLFYIYPLKFLFVALSRQLIGVAPERLTDGSLAYAIPSGQGAAMMLIYGIGYTAVFGVFVLLYLHAYRQREALELSPLEVLKTRASLYGAVAAGWVGLLSVTVVLVGGDAWAGVAGWVYFAASLTSTAVGTWFGRQQRLLLEREAAASPDLTPASGGRRGWACGWIARPPRDFLAPHGTAHAGRRGRDRSPLADVDRREQDPEPG
jgi:hypothetical protein